MRRLAAVRDSERPLHVQERLPVPRHRHHLRHVPIKLPVPRGPALAVAGRLPDVLPKFPHPIPWPSVGSIGRSEATIPPLAGVRIGPPNYGGGLAVRGSGDNMLRSGRRGPSSPSSDQPFDSAVGKSTVAARVPKTTYAHWPSGVAFAPHRLETYWSAPSPDIAFTSRSLIRDADQRSDTSVLSPPTSMSGVTVNGTRPDHSAIPSTCAGMSRRTS